MNNDNKKYIYFRRIIKKNEDRNIYFFYFLYIFITGVIYNLLSILFIISVFITLTISCQH